MKFYGHYRAGAGHGKYLGIIEAPDIDQAFEKMKVEFKSFWENHQRYTECYVDSSAVPYQHRGRRKTNEYPRKT